MSGARLLVVEDEPRVADMLARGLGAEGYAVEVARDGREGLAMAERGGYAAILLDLMLPQLGGREICTQLRHGGDRTPILMLTAMDSLDDKVAGLLTGADDYVTKPFAFDELLARLVALLRRSRFAAPEGATPRVLRWADIVLDRGTMTVARGRFAIALTGKEMALLDLLMASAGRVVTRERILADVWGTSEDPQTNIVDVYVRRLRRKLEEDIGGTSLILTVRGHGYRLDGEAG
jgi:DNA-binding response OmpR family regulator